MPVEVLTRDEVEKIIEEKLEKLLSLMEISKNMLLPNFQSRKVQSLSPSLSLKL